MTTKERKRMVHWAGILHILGVCADSISCAVFGPSGIGAPWLATMIRESPKLPLL
jgi:hypothetical protein